MKNPETIPDLDLLETILSYNFKDRSLLERAITHRSWAHEKVPPGDELQARKLHNESLEFLGDSVLGLVVSNYLCKSYPAGTEGELSRMKHRLVSAPTLAEASQGLKLGEFLRFGRGEEKSGGRQKNALLADVFEAITGAIFIDGAQGRQLIDDRARDTQFDAGAGLRIRAAGGPTLRLDVARGLRDNEWAFTAGTIVGFDRWIF